MIWWGSSFLAVAICFIVVLPNIYISTMEGFKSTDRQLLQMAKVFRMPVKNRVFYIYRPALEPFLRSSMKISLGMCWKSGVAAEVIGTPDRSIGEGLYLSKIYLDTAGVFAWTAVVILLSVCFEKLALWLAQRFFAWKPACRRPVPLKGSVRDKSVSDRLKTGCDCKNPDGREAVRENREAVCENREIVRGSRKTAPDSEGGGLKVDHVSKAFGSLKVLDDFSAFYQKGQTYVLNGPSGSGKTTLLHILAGILKPDSGGVVRNGSCSMVFQEDRLCMDVSAVKNVEMVTGDDAGAKKALLKLLEPEALDKPCRELSGGMKRRVALVRALEAESDYLLLDEPFTGLDARTRKQAEAYIKERQNGRTLILVTHV